MSNAAIDLRYTAPPIDSVMPLGLQKGFLVFSGLVLCGFIIWALIRLVRHRDPLALLALVGGLLTCIWEPIVDTLGQCWHPLIGQITAYEALGRKIPLVLPMTNPWYFGGVGALLFYKFKKGVSTTWVLKAWGIGLVIAFLIEVVPLQQGTWIYYGAQPLKVAGFPLWWSFVNVGGVFAVATTLFAVDNLVHNAFLRALSMVFIVPAADGMANAGAGWPVWYTLNLPDDAFISGLSATVPASIVSGGLAFLLVYLCAALVAQNVPALRRSNSATTLSSRIVTPVRGHAGVRQTASTLLPSGSKTNAP